MATTLIPVGPPTTIAQNVVFALPAKTIFLTSSLAVEGSMDGVAWVALTGANTTGVLVGYVFIRCTVGNAIITCKSALTSSVLGFVVDSLTFDTVDRDVVFSQLAADSVSITIDGVERYRFNSTGLQMIGVGFISDGNSQLGGLGVGAVPSGAGILNTSGGIQGGSYITSMANVSFAMGTVIPAGGAAAASLSLSSITTFGLYVGSGAPTVTAAQGSIYLRSDGSSTSTRAYINTNGAAAWTPITTAT